MGTKLNSQAEDLTLTFSSNSDKDESFVDPKANIRRLRNLFEQVVQAPSQVRSVAKQLTILLYEYKDQDLSSLALISAHPVVSVMATYITNALTFPGQTLGWKVVLETVALVDAYEVTLKSDVCHRLIDELVDMGANDRRANVRARTCFLMKEIFTIETERELEGNCSEEDEESEAKASNDSTKAYDSFDDDVIEIDDVKYPKIRKIPSMSARTLRAMHWASLLERLRRDKDIEVRGSAIKSLAFVPKIQVFINDSGKTAAPDDLILDHLFDPHPAVRTTAIDSFAFTFKETLDRAIDAIESEKDQPVTYRLLKRIIATSLTHFDTSQAKRLLQILYSKENDLKFHEKWRKCLLSKWLQELAEADYSELEDEPETRVYRLDLMLKLINPIANKELSSKLFPTIASICEANVVGEKGAFQWMLQLRAEEIAYLQEEPHPNLKQFRLMKETIVRILGGVMVSEFKDLAQRLFIHRNMIDYLQRKVSEEHPTSIVSRFLPSLYELAHAIKICVVTLCHDPLVVESKDPEQESLLEFTILEMCGLMRQLDNTDPVGRLEWRAALLAIIQECSFVQDREALATIMQDMVDTTVDDKKEAIAVADEIAYAIHRKLTESNEDSQTAGDFEIDIEVVPRCAILLEALLRNTTIDNYSTILKGLVLRLVELATAVDATRPIGCRIIAIAACMDEQILAAHAHILAVLPTELPNEIETNIACLTGISEIVLVKGLNAVASAFYADLDPDSQTDSESKRNLFTIKISKILQVYENAIMSENRFIQLAAIENGLRLMVITGSRWSQIFSRCLFAAYSSGASPKSKAIIEAYVNKEVGWDKTQRLFMAVSIVEAIRLAENWTSRGKLNLSALLSYGLFVLRQHSEDKANGKNKREDRTKNMAVEPDFLGELALVYGILDHCMKFPNSEQMFNICNVLSGCMSMQRHRQILSRDNRSKSLMEAIRNAASRLYSRGQKSATTALLKLHSRLQKFTEKSANASVDESTLSMKDLDEALGGPAVIVRSVKAGDENNSAIFATPKPSQALKRRNRTQVNLPPMKSPKREPLSQISTQESKLSRHIFPTQSSIVKQETASVFDFQDDEDLFE